MNKYRDRWNRSGHRVKQRVIDNMFHFEKKFVRLKRKKRERKEIYSPSILSRDTSALATPKAGSVSA